MKEQINPCEFCYSSGVCSFENKRLGSCNLHLCNLPDETCGFNIIDHCGCFGYDHCPNVKEFYDLKRIE